MEYLLPLDIDSRRLDCRISQKMKGSPTKAAATTFLPAAT
jgi:hypothetical protein